MSGLIALAHVQQSAEGYCLPACARMVLAHLGMQFSEDALIRTLGAEEFGTPSFAIQKLSAVKVHVTYREWSIPQLLATLQTENPVLAFVRTGFLEYWTADLAHAVVIVGATEDQDFAIHDPALMTGPVTVSWNGMLAAWGEFSYRGAVITKA